MALASTGGSSLLAAPTAWNKIYEASADAPFALWRATAPEGFVALGELGTTDVDAPPSLDATATVAEACVVACESDVLLWKSSDGAGALNFLPPH